MHIETEAGPVVVSGLPALGIVFQGGGWDDLQADETLPLTDGLSTSLLFDAFQFPGEVPLLPRILFMGKMAHFWHLFGSR